MGDQWLCESCPKCGQRNWVNNGDPNDMTGVDVDAIECCKCDHRWLLAEPAWLEVMYGKMSNDDFLKHTSIERGRSNPSDEYEVPKGL